MKEKLNQLIKEAESTGDRDDLAVARLLSAVVGTMYEGNGASERLLEYLVPYQQMTVARLVMEIAILKGDRN
jgi:hypothetical protein